MRKSKREIFATEDGFQKSENIKMQQSNKMWETNKTVIKNSISVSTNTAIYIRPRVHMALIEASTAV